MTSRERQLRRWTNGASALLLCVVAIAGPLASAARAQPAALPDPCQLPVVSTVCGAVGGAAGDLASATGDYIMRGVTQWVTDAAVWVTGKVGDLIDNTTSPDLTAAWFEGQYGTMLAVAGALALLMLLLAIIQSVIRQDVWMLVRSAFGYLPIAFILSAVAIAGTGLLIAVTDDISGTVVDGLGAGQAANLLQSVGDAYTSALDQSSGIPLFGVFLGAIILAIASFVLWLEMIIRDAAIYICVFFLPLTFVAMIWPATGRWARRLVELLVAIILAKFLIVAILSLATAAITNTAGLNGDGNTFEQMIAGTALLVLAAWSPFALLRMIPMMELAAAAVTSQRSSVSAAAGSAGIQSPGSYMRQAMDGARVQARLRRTRRPAGRPTCRCGRLRARLTSRGATPMQGTPLLRVRKPAHRRVRRAERSTRARRAGVRPRQPRRPCRPPRRLRRLLHGESSRPLRRARPTNGATHERRRASAVPLRPARAPRSDRVAARAPQVVAIGAGLAGAVLLLRLVGGGGGIALALLLAFAAAVFCFWPVGGRSAEEWLPIVAGHLLRRARGRHAFYSPAPGAGVGPGVNGRPEPLIGLPEPTKNLVLLAAPFMGDRAGVIKDRRANTYTAALAVKVTSFGLLARGEQESRQAGWGGVLASLAREGSPVSRIQWIERTVPADGDEIGRYLGEAWERDSVPLESLSMQSYLELTNAAPATTTDHELVVCLQIDAKLAWRQIKREGGKQGVDAGACSVLSRELEALAERLTAADVQVIGAFRPGILAGSLRVAFDPWSRPGLARLAAADPDRDGIDEATAWPTATETTWGAYHTENAYHATYWISCWPRIEVGVAFLSPLLLHAQMVRAVAVTIEPVSPVKAIREVEAARTTDIADRDLRGRMGFIETARGRRQTEAVARREEELADGHAALRFAGYVTVSAQSPDGLERSCSEIEHAAQMARLELLRLYGQQEEAFTYTLPLCRGLR